MVYSHGDSAWLRPAIVPDEIFPLLLLVGNGIEGDLRLQGNTPAAVEFARGLLLGTGACRRCEPPPAAAVTLYRPGDECYYQHADGRAFLDPVPTGAVVRRSTRFSR